MYTSWIPIIDAHSDRTPHLKTSSWRSFSIAVKYARLGTANPSTQIFGSPGGEMDLTQLRFAAAFKDELSEQYRAGCPLELFYSEHFTKKQ